MALAGRSGCRPSPLSRKRACHLHGQVTWRTTRATWHVVRLRCFCHHGMAWQAALRSAQRLCPAAPAPVHDTSEPRGQWRMHPRIHALTPCCSDTHSALSACAWSWSWSWHWLHACRCATRCRVRWPRCSPRCWSSSATGACTARQRCLHHGACHAMSRVMLMRHHLHCLVDTALSPLMLCQRQGAGGACLCL